MKKILFIHKQSPIIDENPAKFNGQMNGCKTLGLRVFYLEWDGRYIDLVEFGTKKKKRLVKTINPMSNESYYHILYHDEMYKAAVIALKSVHFDYVYLRGNIAMPAAKKMVNQIPADTIFFVEIPSYPLKEDRDGHKGVIWRVGFAISDIYSKYLYDRADRLVLVSVSNISELFGRPIVSIENGADVSSLKRRVPITDDKIHVLMLANMRYYHGYDRVIEGLALYSKRDRIILDFVGGDADGSLAKWRELIKRKGVERNVRFYGRLFGNELDDMFNLASVGIGCLAAHRKNMYATSELKIREYMGRGLPFVYALDDASIEEGFRYALKIPNDDTPIDFDDLVSFAERTSADDMCVDNMRSYADDHMSWRVQFDKVLSSV